MEGTPFGRYRLIELLGRGGMGEVWRAHDTVTDRVVAIKVLPAHLSGDEDFQRRFRREAHAAARLDTPHVVPIHDYGEIDGRLFVSMRLIKGRDLETVLADGPLDPVRAVRIIDQVAKALHAAHQVGLIHRDIKPSNILLDRDDFAYLIDFGIARVADETRLTKSGNTIGTFAYIAPERLDPRTEEDARADIYSLACVLYEALTGQPPFPGSTPAHLIAAHLNAPPPRPSTTQPDVPPQVDEVIATGMAKDPDNRYATTIELANAARDAITVPIQRATASPAPDPPTAPAPPANATMPDDRTPSVSAPPLVDDATPATAASQPTVPAARGNPAVHAGPPRDVGQRIDGIGYQPTQSASTTPTRPQPPPRQQAGALVGAAGPPPPHIGTPQPEPRRPPQRRGLKLILITAIVMILAAAGVTGYFLWSASQTGHPAAPSRQRGQPAAPSGQPGQPGSPKTQIVLPFSGLKNPQGVAVDSAGNVYVVNVNGDAGSVMRLTAGSSTPTALSLGDLTHPYGVAVDKAGNVYVTDVSHGGRVLELAAGSSTPTELTAGSSHRLLQPAGVAVDTAGNVYVADTNHARVVEIPPSQTGLAVVPFAGLSDPKGVAVDSAGNVYVTDQSHNRVLQLSPGSTNQSELPFTGLDHPQGVAVDSAGNIYVADSGNHQVVKLAAGSRAQSVLPFNGLVNPTGVAVDAAGSVYVADDGSGQVVKLPAG